MDNGEPENRSEHRLAIALKSEPETWTAECLLPEQILALVDQTAPEAEAARGMSHVALCARCRREFAETLELVQLADEVRSLEAQPAPAVIEKTSARKESAWDAPRRTFWQRWFSPGAGFALGATAAGLILFVLMLPARTERDSLAAAVKEHQAQVARAEQDKKALEAEIAALKKNQGESARIAKELERLNTRVRTQEVQIARLEQDAAALRQMPLPTPEWLSDSATGQLRGGTDQDPSMPIQIVQPASTATASRTPTLEYRPLAGAGHYQVTLDRVDSTEEVAAPKQISATRWRPAKPLEAGKVYQWAVTAQRRGETVRSPLAKFYVLTDAEKREIEEEKKRAGGGSLALGALYACVGMTDEATQQLKAVLQRDPQNATAARWLKELRKQ